MKKLHFSLMAILFALFSMVSFTACSSDDDDDTPSSGDIKTNIIGEWELTHIKGWYWADDYDETHIIVDKSPDNDDKYRLLFHTDGTCVWYDYYKGGWKAFSGITSYEVINDRLIVTGPDETHRYVVKSLKGNTMICTAELLDEGDTELTFTKK